MPVHLRNGLVRSIGKRMIVTSRRPKVSRPPTDMEKDIAEARRLLKAQRVAPR